MLETAKILQNILAKNGYKTLAVGGFVRDHILNRPFKDIDLATTARPEEVLKILKKNHINVIETGLKHGTVTANLNKNNIEITTLRIDKDCFGRQAEVEFTTSFEQDAKRRDFTINALYMDLESEEVYDYFHGLSDIKNKVLRYIGKPSERIQEDYLRILRLYRFQAVLGFQVEKESHAASQTYLPYLSFISIERIREEILKLLVGKYVSSVLIENTKLITSIFPELVPSVGFKQNSTYQIHDVYTHTCKGVEFLTRYNDEILSLAHLFHDVAKPFCHSTNANGEDKFYNHDIEGERIAASMCYRLKLSTQDTERIKFLIKNHNMLLYEMSTLECRRFIALCAEFSDNIIEDLIKIYEADCQGMDVTLKLPIFNDHCMKMNNVRKEFNPKKPVNSPLTGTEIMNKFTDVKGKKIGVLKEYLKQKVIDGELEPDDKKKSFTMLKKYWDHIKNEKQ